MSIADDIAALRAALAKGVRRVRQDGKEIEYQSADAMLRAIEALEARNATSAHPGFRIFPLAHGDGK